MNKFLFSLKINTYFVYKNIIEKLGKYRTSKETLPKSSTLKITIYDVICFLSMYI